MYPEYEQAKNARTLLTGAWVLLTRNNNLSSTSTAPLLELSLFGEMGLAPRNTVTLALDNPWDHEVGSSAFQGVWLSVFSGIFLAEDNVGHEFVLSRYFWSVFKAKNNLQTLLNEYASTLTLQQYAETYYLMGLIHYYQYVLFGEGNYPANSGLEPAIDYFEKGIALNVMPYTKNILPSDIGAKSFLARLYWLKNDPRAKNLAQEVWDTYKDVGSPVKDSIFWRVSMTEDNITKTTFTGAVTLYGNEKSRKSWNIGWMPEAGDPVWVTKLSEKATVEFTAILEKKEVTEKDPTTGLETTKLVDSFKRAVLPEITKENGIIFTTLDEMRYIANDQDLNELAFRRRHVFNAMLNRAIAIKNTPKEEVVYIPGYLKP